MKVLILASVLFSAIAFPAFGALTDADLDKIRLIVKEEIKTEMTMLRQEFKEEITTLRQEFKEEIAKSEKNIKEYVVLQTGHLDKSLSTYGGLLYIFMPLIIAAIGIPTGIMAWRVIKDRSLEKRLKSLQRK